MEKSKSRVEVEQWNGKLSPSLPIYTANINCTPANPINPV